MVSGLRFAAGTVSTVTFGGSAGSWVEAETAAAVCGSARASAGVAVASAALRWRRMIVLAMNRPHRATLSATTMRAIVPAFIGTAFWARAYARIRGQSSKKIPPFQGNTKLNPGPRKNIPKMTRIEKLRTKKENSTIASLRSSGLVEGLRST
ncbi:MAG: hypothetical protein QOD46_848 [Actinomycetota bacterium]|nr:hypothetical protein [Actinomycetota bacterium]